MTPCRPCARFCVLLPWLASALLRVAAQTTPMPAAPPAPNDKVLTLDAFTVSTAKDDGFVGKESFAGGRMASDLIDTPVAYSVQTREFLDALNLGDLVEAQQWAPNVTLTPDDGGDSMFGGTGISTTRGVPSNGAQRNFQGGTDSLQGGANYDTYNVGRMDYTRGPNSILFGPGGMGGTANAMTKDARVGLNRTTLRLTGGSWNFKRATLDLDRSLGRKLGARVSAMWQNNETWRDYEYTKKKGISPSLTFEPDRRTRIILSGEYNESHSQTAFVALNDQVTGWDGRTTYRGLQPANLPSQVPFGTSRLGTAYYVYTPATGRPNALSEIISYTGTMQTVGAGASPGTVAGVPVVGGVSPGYAGFGIEPVGEATLNAPEALYDRAIQNSYFYLRHQSNPVLYDDVGNVQRNRNATLDLNRTFGSSLFAQVVGHFAKRKVWGNVGEYYDTSTARLDVNELLPTGEANPNFLQPYVENRNRERYAQFIEARSLRGSIAYARQWKWITAKFNLLGAVERSENRNARSIYALPLDPDSRQWGRAGDVGYAAPHYRLYWNQADRRLHDLGEVTVIDPSTGTTRTVTPVWVGATSRPDVNQVRSQQNRYVQTATNLSFFEKRVILLGALRRDKLERQSKLTLLPLELPPGETGLNPIYRPEAPADYRQLTYRTRSAAGVASGADLPALVRPRDARGVRLPQYENDRFQDDYSLPRAVDLSTTYSLGSIYNATRWLALWGNYAETFNPSDVQHPDINYTRMEPTTSIGYDFGLRLVFGGGRVVANVTRYKSEETGNAFNATIGTIRTLINANKVGDLSDNGMNQQGLAQLPGEWMDIRDRQTEGYELEIVGNLRRNWRVVVNGALPQAYQLNAYQRNRAWLAANDAALRSILRDAGVLIDANNLATVDASIPAAERVDSVAAAGAWNSLQTTQRGWTTGQQKITRTNRYTANFFTDYRFETGRLKNLRLGFGVRFRGRELIGNRGGDTIRNPANPNGAIDDPDVNVFTDVWSKAYHLGTMTVGYPFHVYGQRIALNLSIDNVFNYREVRFVGTANRPPGGDVTNPSRVATPARFVLTDPRSFKLSAEYQF